MGIKVLGNSVPQVLQPRKTTTPEDKLGEYHIPRYIIPPRKFIISKYP